MPFRFDRDALVHRVDNLEDDLRRRDAEIGRLRRVAAQAPSARWRRLAIGLGALALLLTLVAMRMVLRPIAEAAARPVEVSRWQPLQEGPLFADLDGDGSQELVGAYDGTDGERWLGVFDADSTTPRWRIAMTREEQHFALTADAVVIAGAREVVVHRLSDGAEVRRVALPEPAREICVRRDRSLPIWIRGTHEHRLLHADGRLEPALRPPFCDPHEVTTPPRIRGLNTERALIDGRHVVVVARDDRGAALAGFVVGDDVLRWQISLPGAPLTAGRDVLLLEEHALLARSGVVVAYAAATGAEMWRAKLPDDEPVTRIAGAADRIAVVQGTRLTLLDGRGRPLLQLGR